MTQAVELHNDRNPSPTTPANLPLATELRVLRVGHHLYQEGEPRSFVYRVESGILAVSVRRKGQPNTVIMMAGKGNYVGLGCLQHYRDNARAAIDTIVRCIPNGEFALLAEGNPKLRKEQDDAIKRDFEHGKALAYHRGRSAPVECVAAFLVALSRQNSNEGRDPSTISDSLKCGLVAGMLDLEINTLSDALLELQKRELIEHGPASSLRLKNIDALERIAGCDIASIENVAKVIPATDASLKLGGANSLPTLRRLDVQSAAKNQMAWKDELLEIFWLVFFVLGLSVVGVVLAVMILAFAL